MRALQRAAEFLGALILAPLLLLIAALALFATDIAYGIRRRKAATPDRQPGTKAASVVIPNWNGRDLLEKYLPSVIAAMDGNPGNEIIVVENGSTDGSAEFVRRHFPEVTLLALPANLGFGGGSNAGFRAAKNNIVVLLNSDMRVEPGFLAPLLAGFTAPDVFAVACQIFLSDPGKRREETGLTEGWWQSGKLMVSHRADPAVNEAFPCFYAGGGSAAFDRAKFLELGGFDELLAPFYLEDTDLGYLAWKRGWKVLFEPGSVVFHEHRGTIGRTFSPAYIHSILKKNYLLFTWKNIHNPGLLMQSLAATWAGALASAVSGPRPLRANLAGLLRAVRQIAGAMQSRYRARALSRIDDREAFARTRGGHFRDRFLPVSSSSERLRVLFVSPYPILPPAHGGAVFMLETVRELSKLCELHVLILLDEPYQEPDNRELEKFCASLEIAVRPRTHGFPTIQPHAVQEFGSRDIAWLIDRLVYLHRIDIVQMEYTAMGQYLENYRRIGTALFEHDVYFQSVGRTARHMDGAAARWKARFEYLRALRYELQLLRRCDRVQVCTRENRQFLLEFDPQLESRVQSGLRACINTRAYPYPGGPREPGTVLFIGSSRHAPNRMGVEWFLARVWKEVLAEYPKAVLHLAGFDETRDAEFAGYPRIKMLGYVEDVKPLLATCSVFVCPILSGSGVRVKLLEAFAAGIPVVSTCIGAEGLTDLDGEICSLADDPFDFAWKTVRLLESAEASQEMTTAARERVEKEWDGAAATARLYASYRELLKEKRGAL